MDTMLQGGLISLAGSGLLWATGELARQRVKGLKSFKKLPNLAVLRRAHDNAPQLVGVRARVAASSPIIGELSGRPAVIVKTEEDQVIEKRVRSGGEEIKWERIARPLRSEVVEADWMLTDGTGVELPVERGSSEPLQCLEQTGNRLIPANQKGRDRMAEEELGERLVGIDRTEEALLVGRVITALGVLDTAVDYPAAFQNAPRKGGQMLVLKVAEVSPKPLEQLIDDSRQAAEICDMGTKVLAVIGGGMLLGAGVAYAIDSSNRRR